MFAAIGRFIYRARWIVLIAGLIFVAVSGLLGSGVFGKLKNGGFYDPNADSTKVMNELHDKLGRDESTLLVLFTSKDGTKVDSPQYKAAVESALAKVQGQQGIGTITSYYNSGSQALVSNDRTSTYAAVGFKGSDDTHTATLDRVRPLLTSDRLQVRLGGMPAFSQEITDLVKQDLEQAEMFTFPILAVLLIVIFGSLVAAVLPLAVGGMVILGAFLFLRIGTEVTDVSIFAINIITMLGLGLAIDYSLFMVSRFREELARNGGDVQPALVRTMETAGRTVVFSGLTVAISLLSLMVFPQMFLSSMGMGGALAVFVAVICSVTVLPAVLAILGHRVNSLSVAGLFRRVFRRPTRPVDANGEAAPQGFWYSFSTFVMRHPVAVLIVTIIPLVIMGLPFLHVKMSVADVRSMPPRMEARQINDILEAQFPKNETTPIQIVVQTDKPALDPASLSSLYDYTRRVAEVPGVTRIESLVNINPALNKDAYTQFYSQANLGHDPNAAKAAAGLSKDDYSLVAVYFDYEATSDQAKNLLHSIRSLDTPAGFTPTVGGVTAIEQDFLSSIGSRVPLNIGIIVVVVFILLFLMLGSVVVPIKAVLLNILSLSVSFGALVWIFQEGHLSNVLGFTSVGSLDGTEPMLIFAIAFALSMDYEVFLLSRIKEHYDRTGDNTASVAVGVQKTGAIITSAALLLVVVLAGFATGEIAQIKQAGVGLSLAVLVDATLVRMLLVPATMRIMGKVNWWAPKPLAWLYNRLGLGETESAPVEREPEEKENLSAEPAA